MANWQCHLTNDGTVDDLSIAPGDQPEIDNGVEISLENLHKINCYEISTARTQRFVVQNKIDFRRLGRRRRRRDGMGWRNEEKHKRSSENKEGE